MAALQPTLAQTPETLAASSKLVLFPKIAPFDAADLVALSTDFFRWLEEIWQFPVVQPEAVTWRDLERLLSAPRLAEAEWYTLQDLCLLWGHTVNKVRMDLQKYAVCSDVRLERLGRSGNAPKMYQGRQLAPVLAHWEWQRLHAVLDACWSRFAQPRCGQCGCCQMVNIQLNCERRNSTLLRYRRSLYHFLRGVRDHGSIAAWWQREHQALFTRTKDSVTEESGLVLLYLLDGGLLSLTYDELLQLPLPDITHADLARPWRNLHPEEYACFLRGLEAANYGETTREDAITLFALMVLLKHGLSGVTPLSRKLEAHEATQALREDRLLTHHLGYGVYLPCLLTADICTGHIVLDEVRQYLWTHQAKQTRLTSHPHTALRRWLPMHARAVELALAAPAWHGERPLLVPRPETTAALPNRVRLRERAEREGYSVTLLPPVLQQAIKAHLTYRYQEQHVALRTLSADLSAVVPFLAWAREHTTLTTYPEWDKERIREVLREYFASRAFPTNTVYFHVSHLFTFFQTLAQLELPHPRGYQAIASLLPVSNKESRQVPREEVLDRVFHDGVCQLDYDPLSRLALTIQYFCGTRITETCDLHLFCILEEKEGQAYLLIPLGKSKRERLFPIVEVGMGPLLTFMDEVVKRQLRPDGSGRPKALARTNPRYLDMDPEQAATWYYLFDRSTDERRGCKTQTRLSPSRVTQALHEALILAARVNPEGLFREETYSPCCRRTRKRGERCCYVAPHDGVTTCPVCGGPLPGRRGHRCYWKLKEDFCCEGKAEAGAYFCPTCDAPLAEFIFVGTHAFRHNSVTRAHRNGIALEHNMRLHGHLTVPMHLRYLHLLPEDLQQEVRQVFAEKRLREIRLTASYTPGQVIEDGVAHTATLPEFLGLTLRRALKRRTAGLWGGFWAGALASQGTLSPMVGVEEIVVTEETYVHTVAQYRYEALGLAVSEVALERGTRGKFTAQVPCFLNQEQIDTLVTSHLPHIQEYMRSPLGVRLMEADVREQREFLNQLAEMLRPWWEPLGTIEHLVTALTPGGMDAFTKE